MGKYKLINKTTNEEHLCEKIAVDGFDYYVSDNIKGEKGLNYNFGLNKLDELPMYYSKQSTEWNFCRKVIATNNPRIFLPRVIEQFDIEGMALEYSSKKGNPNPEGYTKLQTEKLHGFIDGYNASQASHPFTESDMIEYANWIADTKKHGYSKQLYEAMLVNKVNTTKELLEIFKTQQVKTIYYEQI